MKTGAYIMADKQTQTVTIDGTEYNVADLSENARNQVVNLRVTDAEIEKLKQQLAIFQTARTAYAKALSEELPKKEMH
jgi:glycerate kinase